jgi:hypothetical protein
MKKVLAILAMASFATFAMAGPVTQGTATSSGAAGSAAPTVDVLGAHNNYGRGCAGCHAPHSGARGNGNVTTDAQTGENALFGQDYGALYGQTMNFGDVSPTSTGTNYQLVTPTAGTALASLTAQQYSDLRGIIMCLACHDGNVAKGAMMQNQAYEQQIGALPTSYGSQAIPTLLGNNGVGAGIYNNDHPVGELALVNKAMGAVYSTVYVNGVMTVASAAASTTYSQFITSYGAPALLPGAHGSATPLTAANLPYVVCTTCHNQHVMNVYAASASNPINGSGTGTYATYFFINGPYNVNDVTVHPTKANSTTQFCRQCHTGESNEANGGTLPTSF